MATVTIANDGTISVALSAQEQGLAQILLADKGADSISAVFNLWFTNATSEVFNARFALLPAQDKADILTKMAAARG